MQRPPAIDHEIFRDDFKPVDHRLLPENVVVVRNAQPDPHSVFRETVKAIRRHFDKLAGNPEGVDRGPDSSKSGPGNQSWLPLLSRRLRSVGCAAALALAGVLALATLVA